MIKERNAWEGAQNQCAVVQLASATIFPGETDGGLLVDIRKTFKKMCAFCICCRSYNSDYKFCGFKPTENAVKSICIDLTKDSSCYFIHTTSERLVLYGKKWKVTSQTCSFSAFSPPKTRSRNLAKKSFRYLFVCSRSQILIIRLKYTTETG